MNAKTQYRRLVSPRMAGVGLVALGLVVLACALLAAPSSGRAQSFPFGHEFILDASPMRGSKKVPLLDIEDAGSAEIELWCNSVKAQLVVAGDTITIITGETTARQCPPERSRADEDLVTALAGITNWRMDGSSLVLTGGQTLQFRAQTN